MADATILQGYRKLAESQAKRADIAGEFTKALDLSGRKARKEKEIEELNQRIADRLETLDGNINLNAVDDPKLKSALGQFGTTSKYSFSDKANQVGRLNDPTSMEHMKLVDEMNGINDQFKAVRAEMDYISKMQADYLNIIDEDGGFSVGQKDTEQVKALEQIFGGGGDYSVSVKDGHIVYNVNGKDYAAKDLKLPGRKAFEQATGLMQTNAGLVSMGRALNSADEQLLRTQYDSMFKTESALRSILSDGDFGDVIPTSDIDIDDMGFEDAKATFINRLINANKASARRGIKIAQDASSKKTPAGKKDRMPEYIEKLDALYATPGVPKVIGGVKVYYDPDVDMVDPEGPRVQKGGYVYKGGGQTVVLSYDEMIDFLNS